MISMIAAMDRKRVIGINNALPWKLSADLRHFKTLTTGKTIVMGRKTFDSIGRPLPERRNIILSRDENLAIEGCETVHSTEQVLMLESGDEELMVIGGEQIYRLLMPFAQRLYITEVDVEVEGDAFFPAISSVEWIETQRRKYGRDDKNEYDFAFVAYERKGR